jgi:hypothetical protein
MSRSAMRRLAATVLVSAALTGGLAAGVGTALAVPPAGSVTTLPADISAGIGDFLAGLPTGSLQTCPNTFCYGIG